MRNIILFSLLCPVFFLNVTGQPAIDQTDLDALISRSKQTNSSALVVYLEGKLYYENYFGNRKQKIEAMSSTKSIVSLAIGKMLTDGLLRSVDQYVYEFYPMWNVDVKREITIRHLMNHTSGLQNYTNTSVEIYPSKDFVRLALDAQVVEKPGTRFRYNNKAVNLLAGIVEKVSGKKLDVYLKENLFSTMGILDFQWSKDKSGNPHGMSGFQVLPADLAKLGQLYINRGGWNGQQLIKETWFDEIVTPSALEPTCSLLWWIIYGKRTAILDAAHIGELKQYGMPDEVLGKLEPLKGTYEDSAWRRLVTNEIINTSVWKPEYMEILQKNNVGLSRKKYDDAIGYATRGSYGNHMFVNPSKKIVVVRMITESAYTKSNDTQSDFADFFDFASSL